MPSKNHFGYNQMKSNEREQFLKWYNEHVNNDYVFDFKKELIDYCRSDVDILRRSMLKFREDFIKLENIDPHRYMTIASVLCLYTELIICQVNQLLLFLNT